MTHVSGRRAYNLSALGLKPNFSFLVYFINIDMARGIGMIRIKQEMMTWD